MTIWSSIECAEVHGSRKDGRSWTGGPRASVQLTTAYDNRYLLSEDLFRNRVWPFTPPAEAPLRVQDIGISYDPTDYTEDGQTIVYKFVTLDVTYGYDESAGQTQGGGSEAGRQLYTEDIEPLLEVISVMDLKFYWKDNDAPEHFTQLDETNFPTVKEYKVNINRTFYNWISVPATFYSLIGTVNDAEETMLGTIFPAETLLFIPRRVSRAVSSTGSEGYTVQVSFSYNRNEWNKFPIPKDSNGKIEYETLYPRQKVAPGDPVAPFVPYTSADFSDWIF